VLRRRWDTRELNIRPARSYPRHENTLHPSSACPKSICLEAALPAHNRPRDRAPTILTGLTNGVDCKANMAPATMNYACRLHAPRSAAVMLCCGRSHDVLAARTPSAYPPITVAARRGWDASRASEGLCWRVSTGTSPHWLPTREPCRRTSSYLSPMKGCCGHSRSP